MEKFMAFNLQNGTEIMVRTSAIMACHSLVEKGETHDFTQLMVLGIEKPFIVKGDYENIKSWIERASE